MQHCWKTARMRFFEIHTGLDGAQHFVGGKIPWGHRDSEEKAGMSAPIAMTVRPVPKIFQKWMIRFFKMESLFEDPS